MHPQHAQLANKATGNQAKEKSELTKGQAHAERPEQRECRCQTKLLLAQNTHKRKLHAHTQTNIRECRPTGGVLMQVRLPLFESIWQLTCYPIQYDTKPSWYCLRANDSQYKLHASLLSRMSEGSNIPMYTIRQVCKLIVAGNHKCHGSSAKPTENHMDE